MALLNIVKLPKVQSYRRRNKQKSKQYNKKNQKSEIFTDFISFLQQQPTEQQQQGCTINMKIIHTILQQ